MNITIDILQAHFYFCCLHSRILYFSDWVSILFKQNSVKVSHASVYLKLLKKFQTINLVYSLEGKEGWRDLGRVIQ